MISLKDKVVILTGAGGGIGRAIAVKLAQAGMSLVLLGGNDRDKLTATVKLAEKFAPCLALPGDLTDLEFLSAGINAAVKQFGRIGDDHIAGLDPINSVLHHQIAASLHKVKDHPIGVEMEVVRGGIGGIGACCVTPIKTGQVFELGFLILLFHNAHSLCTELYICCAEKSIP